LSVFPLNNPSLPTGQSLNFSDLYPAFGLSHFSLGDMSSEISEPDPSQLPYISASPRSAVSKSAFADDLTLDVPLLKVMTAGVHIARLLGCSESIFDPTASRVLMPI